MGRMIAYACQLLFALFALTHGQTLSFKEIGDYTNKTKTANLLCSLDTALVNVVNIFRNTSLAFNCPGGCNSQGLSSDYSATQNNSAGITMVTILNTTKDRDGVQWVCRYGSTLSAYVTPIVITPASSSRLIEESGYIVLELICTYPHTSLDLTFYLGTQNYTEGKLERRNTTCTSTYEASVNYTLTFPAEHVHSYNGTFNVFVNNGFYIARIIGSRSYPFSAPPPPPPDDYTGAIVGGTIGGVAFIAIIIGGVIVYIKCFKSREKWHCSC